MNTFKNKVAVITGAANGIGRGIARRCVEEGMKVVLADIHEPSLAEVEEDLKSAGGTVLALNTDVAKIEDMRALARTALDTYGSVHLLCNNAGLTTYKRTWHMSIADWEWVIGVNLWGVIHGLNVFLPIMLKQDEDAHIVNTSSEAGIIGGRRNMAGYYATKSAIIALSETVFHELAETTSRIHISVLIPGMVRSMGWDPERYRPAQFEETDQEQETDSKVISYEDFKRRGKYIFNSKHAMDPARAAQILFQGIRENKFYIRTHPKDKVDLIRARVEDLLAGNNPVDRMPSEREKMGVKHR
jgi:NAD(P)-dependent dehydrogenase (short-subunit alcohol dehydrogenase family)